MCPAYAIYIWLKWIYFLKPGQMMRHAVNDRNDAVTRMLKFNTKPFVQSNVNWRVWFFVVNHTPLGVFNVPGRNGDSLIEYMYQGKVRYTLSLIALLYMILCHIYIASIVGRLEMDNNRSVFFILATLKFIHMVYDFFWNQSKFGHIAVTQPAANGTTFIRILCNRCLTAARHNWLTGFTWMTAGHSPG